jgi:predicted RNase H-like nuclease (RuvC/YqgF family)
MSKQKTAMQGAIEIHKQRISDLISGLANNKVSYSDQVAIELAITVLEGTITTLTNTLPTERQQIEQAFSDGFNDFMVENYLTAAQYYEQNYNEQK